MNHRIKREIQKITLNPPFGISCNFKEDSLNSLEACVVGVPGTPYEKGVFELELNLTDKYPFQPPQIRFVTPVYHPNIDNAGRICMDLLKMPPNGNWRPTITIEGLLTAIQSLLANPNPDDPLVPDIAEEFKYNRQEFETKARNSTEKYASQNKSPVEPSRATEKNKVFTDKTNDSTSEKKPCERKENEEKSKNENPLKRRLSDVDENVENEMKRKSV